MSLLGQEPYESREQVTKLSAVPAAPRCSSIPDEGARASLTNAGVATVSEEAQALPVRQMLYSKRALAEPNEPLVQPAPLPVEFVRNCAMLLPKTLITVLDQHDPQPFAAMSEPPPELKPMFHVPANPFVAPSVVPPAER